MDIFYCVKQLAHEINVLEAQIREKKTALCKLWGALSHQEQLLIDSPAAPKVTAAPPPKKAP